MLCFLCPQKAKLVSYFWNVLAANNYVIYNTDPAPCPRAGGKQVNVDVTSHDGDIIKPKDSYKTNQLLFHSKKGKQFSSSTIISLFFDECLISFLFVWNKGVFFIMRRKVHKTPAVYVCISTVLLAQAHINIQWLHTFSLPFAYILYTMQHQIN